MSCISGHTIIQIFYYCYVIIILIVKIIVAVLFRSMYCHIHALYYGGSAKLVSVICVLLVVSNMC